MSGEQDQIKPGGAPLDFLFSFKGGIGRGQFLAGFGIIVVLLFCLLAAAASFMDPRGGPGLFIPLTIILLVLVAWIHSALVVKRLRDAVQPSWLYFVFGPGPFALLLAAELAGSLWFMVILVSLGLVIAPAFFPSKLAESST